MISLRPFWVSLLLGCSLVVCVSPAIAQTTWIPEFQPNQHIYVDPKLSQHAIAPIDLQPLTQQLQQAARKHNLEIYIVATEQGREALSPDTNWAVVKLDDLVAQWQNHPQFPQDKYLTILWVRRFDNVNKGWVAVNAGSELRRQGLTGAAFADPNGLVIPVLKQYMPNHPDQAILAIINNANQELDRYAATVKLASDQTEPQQPQQQQEVALVLQQEQESAAFRKGLVGNGSKALLGLGGVGSLAWLWSRFRSKRTQALSTLASWQERLKSANELYLKLYDSYFEFLQVQSSGATKFQGQTLVQYQAAVTDFTEFTVRLEAANQRLKLAQEATNRTLFPQIAPFNRAIALLTTEPVEITGAELPLEMATLFGGMVVKTQYEPEQLLAAMADLFQRTHQALAQIVAALQGVAANQQAIAAFANQISIHQSTLAACDLPWTPYEARWQQMNQANQACQALQSSDPLTAYADSEQIKQEIEALNRDLERAIALHQALPRIEEEIAQSVAYTHATRSQPIAYAYPVTEDETPPVQASVEFFRLTEAGHDPDLLVAQAYQHQELVRQALPKGQLDEAEAAMKAAIETAQQAHRAVEQTLAAKSFVESQVPVVRSSVVQLASEIPSAIQALEHLQSEFLRMEYPQAADDLERAQQTITTTPKVLSTIRQAYDEQRYMAAQQLLSPLEPAIQTRRAQLVNIHQCLANLQQLRQQSREITALCQQRAIALEQKLQTHRFTTAAATDAQYEQLRSRLGMQAIDVAQPMTHWWAAHETAKQLLQACDALDLAIEQQSVAYQQAQQRLATLASVLSQAEIVVNSPETRDPARQKLAQAQAALQALQTAIAQPKSDWQAIVQKADQVDAIAGQAKEFAQGDRSAAEAAKAAVDQAGSQIRLAKHDYGHGVTINLTSAQQHLELAHQLLQGRNYEAAENAANQVKHAVAAAESNAQSQAAALEAEMRRQAEAQHAASTTSHSSFVDSSSSYDSSYSSSSYDSSSGGSSYDSGSGGSSYDSGSGGGSY